MNNQKKINMQNKQKVFNNLDNFNPNLDFKIKINSIKNKVWKQEIIFIKRKGDMKQLLEIYLLKHKRMTQLLFSKSVVKYKK